jgi:predicted transcriptional regulator
MNAKQRKTLQCYAESLYEIKSAIEEMMDEETEKFDNMPEGLQESDRGEAILEAIEKLESSASSLEEAIDQLDEITEG